MNESTDSSSRWDSRLARIVELGVNRDLSPGDARRVRFCNAASALITPIAVAFSMAEAPLILEWGESSAKDWLIFILRVLASWPFLLPLYLNARRSWSAARLTLVYWSILFLIGQTALYAQNGPAHLFFLSVASVVMAIFPREERRAMLLALTVSLMTLILCLWLRQLGDPLVPVISPKIRLVNEYTITLGAFAVAAAISLVNHQTTTAAETALIEQQKRAERLLLNILPRSIADRLQENPGPIADGFDEVTVMFADLVGFTPLSQKLSPRELVALMDRVFSAFDEVAESLGLEKIKTIGDAYMVAGGIPKLRRDHPEAVADMALALNPIVAAIPSPTGDPLSIRIGIATGAAVAGVIGKKKFIYDLWGDTVNTASRLESHGIPGRIQVNEATFKLLENKYLFEERGVIDLKGKGPTPTWFLEGRR